MDINYDEKLAEISKQLKGNVKPQPVTARAFLEWFGAHRRSLKQVAMIRGALQKYQLATEPDFESVFIDSTICFRRMAGQAASDGRPQTSPEIDLDPTFRIRMLEPANRKPVSVKPDAFLSEAVTLMLSNDYSQLPVMTNEREVKGTISWASIGSRLALGKKCEFVRDCLESHHEISADTTLLIAIDEIIKYQYVLIRDEKKIISGIVTTSDLSLQFRQLGEPFLLIGELESHVRRMIHDRYTIDELKDICDPGDRGKEIESIFDLTFGDYIRLIEKPCRWEKLGLSVDRQLFIRQLDEIRQIRNDIMHFDPDGISDQDMEKLRCFVRFMQDLARIGVI